MVRWLHAPYAGVERITGVVSVADGGTGADNLDGAMVELETIRVSTLAQPNGLATINSNNKIPYEQIPDPGSNVSIIGPKEVFTNTPATYVISNFDFSTPYITEAIVGSVTINKDVITYNPGNTSGAGGFIINDKTFNINILTQQPYAPSIISPLPDSDKIYTNINIVASAYSTIFDSAHQSTDWEIATNSSFSNLVDSSYDDVENLSSWNPTGLQYNQSYYVRVRYKDSDDNYSPWSNTVSFFIKPLLFGSVETNMLSPSTLPIDAEFGYRVALSSNGLILAVTAVHSSNSTPGQLFVFVKDGGTWVLADEIQGISNERFGNSLQISSTGDTIFVGAKYYNNEGALHIYRKVGFSWEHEATIKSSDISATDQFGHECALSADGNTLAVASIDDDDRGTNSGSVYVFTKSGSIWLQQAKIVPSDGANADRFGNSLSISGNGNTLVIGTMADDSNRGSAYVYARTSAVWNLQTKLLASDGASGDNFGNSVSISEDGSTIVVGAFNDNDKGTYSGSTYIFTKTGSAWTQQKKLTASDGVATDQFGYTVKLSYDGELLFVSAIYDDDMGTNSGSIYVFKRDGGSWIQDSKVATTNNNPLGYLGYSISLSNDNLTLVASAPNSDSKKGRVYIFG